MFVPKAATLSTGTRMDGRGHPSTRLRNDPERWADYRQELRVAEGTTADGLGNARDEYAEYNR
jgi:hypothetical protein